MFKLNDVTKIYSQGEQSVTALSGLELEIGEVGIVSIVGESGSGKTTLLNLLAGFDKYNKGEIYFEDRPMSMFSETEWNSYYSEDVGFIFQEYNVIEEFTVWENIELPLKILDISSEKKQEIIKAALDKVGLEHIKDKKVNKLSGGQKQRVAIARAYVKAPKVIFADEPTGNLDYDNSIKVFEMLKDISRDILVIVVTHNNTLAKEYSDRIIRLSDGLVDLDNVLSKEAYKVTLSSEKYEMEVADFDDIIEFIKKHSNDKMEYILKAQKIEDKALVINVNKTKKEQYSKRGMSIREIIVLAKSILAKRRIRYALSMGIFMLTNFLMLLFVDFAFYDEDKVVSQYLQQYDESYIFVERQLDNLMGYEEDGNIAYVTKEMKDDLMGIIGEGTFSQFDSMEFTNDDHLLDLNGNMETDTFSIFVEGRVLSDYILKEIYNIDDLYGNEVVITESIAKKAGITQEHIGNEYYVDGDRIILKAIINVNEDALFFSNEYVQYIRERNEAAFVSIGGNFLTSESLYMYANNNIRVSNIEKGDYTQLVGNIPNDDNEVVLSYSFIYEYLDIEKYEEIIGKTYYLKDLYDNKYGNSLSENMNLYDYLGEKITVVGIADFEGDVYVMDNVYNDMAKDYYDIYIYDKIGCYSKDWTSVVKNLHKSKFMVSDSNLENVYVLVNMKPVLLKYIILVLMIMVTLTLFLMISLISYSIRDNSKVIGIMKSIGISKIDIKRIFAIEPIKIMLTTFSGAVLLLFGIVRYINIEYASGLYGRAYEILPISPLAILLTGMFMIVIGFVTVLLPLKEMDNKTIIDTIRY